MRKRIRMFVLLALVLVGATSMMALPDHEIEYTYYTDASKTEECGWRIISCSGVYSGGCRTAFYTIYHGMDC
ncbi:MAG TPA: hypothetical protein VEK11_17935 [Thermoanaerobaculia bacterium]|jgi:hypothetical protein|nr:hypothetical protein [Thermoanaerobaculia bacterium]